MGNSKTIVCPNCGAVSSNLDNCEYCGSILVKLAFILQADGKEVSKELKELGIGKSVYVNPTIFAAIQKQIEQSKKFESQITTRFSYCDSLGDMMSIESLFLDFYPNSAPILTISFDMENDKENLDFRRFEEANEIYSLFEVEQDYTAMKCSLQMDNDARLTAQLIHYVITDVLKLSIEKLTTHTYIELDDEEYYQIVTEDQAGRLKEDFDYYYSKYLKNIQTQRDLKKCDNELYRISNENLYKKSKELEIKYQERLKKIANREHFIHTQMWHNAYERIINDGWNASKWISENATKQEFEEIINNKNDDALDVDLQDAGEKNNVANNTMAQHQKNNSNINTSNTSSESLQNIAKQFVETLNTEVQTKTNINLSRWVIIVLILVIIILLVV